MTNLERLLRVPRVDADHGFSLAPDGATVAFSWNVSGRWELYLLPLAQSADPVGAKTLRLLLPGQGARFNPKFSPVNPQQLLCAADFDGSESFHLLLLDLSSGECVDLIPGEHGDFALQPNFAWSPDGAEVAFISNRSGCFDAYILNLATRQQRLVAALGHPIWDVTWSPDGRHLALTAETSGSDYGVYILDCASSTCAPAEVACPGGQARELAHSIKDPSFSPDGQKLALCATQGEFYQIGILDLAAQQITWLTDSDGDKTSPAWDKTGARLTYIHSSGASNKIVVQNMPSPSALPRRGMGLSPSPTGRGGGEGNPLTDHSSLITDYSLAPGLHTAPQFTPDGQNLVFILFWLMAVPWPETIELDKNWQNINRILETCQTEQGIKTNEHRGLLIAQKNNI